MTRELRWPKLWRWPVPCPNLDLVGEEVVALPRPQPGLLFGTGKVEELKARLEDNDIELVLIDGPVTPVQQRNLETGVEGQVAGPHRVDP